MSNESWFKMYRRIRTSDLLRHPYALTVFIFLLSRVRLRDGNINMHPVKAGQAFSSWKDIAEHTDLTRQQIRTAIKYLKSTNRITTEPTNKFTVFTVVNWDKYQGFENLQPTKQPTKQPTSNQQATNKQPTSNHIDRSIECIERENGHSLRVGEYPALIAKLKSENPPTIATAVQTVYACHDAFATVPEFSISNELHSSDPSLWIPAIEYVAGTFAGADLQVPMAPLRKKLQPAGTTKRGMFDD